MSVSGTSVAEEKEKEEEKTQNCLPLIEHETNLIHVLSKWRLYGLSSKILTKPFSFDLLPKSATDTELKFGISLHSCIVTFCFRLVFCLLFFEKCFIYILF